MELSVSGRNLSSYDNNYDFFAVDLQRSMAFHGPPTLGEHIVKTAPCFPPSVMTRIRKILSSSILYIPHFERNCIQKFVSTYNKSDLENSLLLRTTNTHLSSQLINKNNMSCSGTGHFNSNYFVGISPCK
jgi:hypothetical protein